VNWIAIGVTLKLAMLTALALVVIGLPVAYWVSFSRWRWKFLVESVVALPLVLPPTVLGFYILVAIGPHSPFGRFYADLAGHPLPFTFEGLLIASVLYSLPFAVQPFAAAFDQVDPRRLAHGNLFQADPADVRCRRGDGIRAEFRAHARRIRCRADGRRQHRGCDEDRVHRHLR
jgi:ABC-type molybdate transport system permease subunit